MKPPAGMQTSGPPSREQIAQRLAAGKVKPKESRSSQQDIQAKVTSIAALTATDRRVHVAIAAAVNRVADSILVCKRRTVVHIGGH